MVIGGGINVDPWKEREGFALPDRRLTSPLKRMDLGQELTLQVCRSTNSKQQFRPWSS